MSDTYDTRRARAIREACSRIMSGEDRPALEALEWNDEQRQVHVCRFSDQCDSNGYRLVCVVADSRSADVVATMLMDLADARRELSRLRREAAGVSDE